jgi:stage V sporulation protein R
VRNETNVLQPFPAELEEARQEIEQIARSLGLDFFPTIFEMVDYDQINQIAAYGGFPQRYPHWRFGMEYERLRKTHSYGLGRIYEMVINNDPCYAYLLSDNAFVDQKLVMAHVYGHCDFFKNNVWFSKTSRKMMDGMANHATRIWRHIERHGYETVEAFIDVCLSLENLIDPHAPFMADKPTAPVRPLDSRQRDENHDVTRFPSKPYMDRYVNPREKLEAEREAGRVASEAARRRFPPTPQRDVLRFLLQHAPLMDWQADILSIIRNEAYYFAPQGQTKIMNEGWASYWHSHMMTRYLLRDDEVITYADHHSGTLATSPGRLNPYKVGIELLRDIEDRWNKGRFGKEYEECEDIERRRSWDTEAKLGREKIFEVRRIYNDVTFIDDFLTPEFVDRYKMYHYRQDPATGRMVVVNRDFDVIKQTMLFQLTNHGQPFIYVVDGNYANRGELYLAHKHIVFDVDIKFANECLRNLHLLWQRPVHLQARIDDDMMLFTADGEGVSQQKISAELPEPAHTSIV